MTEISYKKLKHFKLDFSFFVACDSRSDLLSIILNEIDHHISVDLKYKNRGHTKESHIKSIDKSYQIEPIANGFKVSIQVHAKHYTPKIHFNKLLYLVELQNKLYLPFNAISEAIPDPKPDPIPESFNQEEKPVPIIIPKLERNVDEESLLKKCLANLRGTHVQDINVPTTSKSCWTNE